MPTVIEGHMNAAGKRFAVVISRWNSFFGEPMLRGALDTLRLHGAADEDVVVVRCPGSYELPMVADQVAQRGGVDAIICLGVLIRGSTIHFELIAGEAAKGIGQVSMKHGLPVSFGVITCENQDQAAERSGSKAGNKGIEAASAAIEMVNLYEAIRRP
jgi:6,7-dimethyl-8-ribityllumazine synthase